MMSSSMLGVWNEPGGYGAAGSGNLVRHELGPGVVGAHEATAVVTARREPPVVGDRIGTCGIRTGRLGARPEGTRMAEPEHVADFVRDEAGVSLRVVGNREAVGVDPGRSASGRGSVGAIRRAVAGTTLDLPEDEEVDGADLGGAVRGVQRPEQPKVGRWRRHLVVLVAIAPLAQRIRVRVNAAGDEADSAGAPDRARAGQHREERGLR